MTAALLLTKGNNVTLSSNELGKILTLNLYAPGILGAQLKQAKFEEIISYQTAQQYIDPAALHANVWGLLPTGTPNDFRKYYYGKFRTENDAVVVLGLPYIASYTIHTQSNAIVTVNGIDPISAPQILREMLNAQGYFDISIEIDSV